MNYDDFISTRPKWHSRAACRGMMFVDDAPTFFPDRGGGVQQVALARQVCAGCPVSQECLDFALRFAIDSGVYGGMSPQERIRERRRRGMTGTDDMYSFELASITSRLDRKSRLG